MPVYYVITKTGNRHEIEAPNVRAATSKAEHEFGPQNIATAPQESMKKPATDRASLHRALDAGMNIAPKVTRDATICNRCGQIVRCNNGYFKPHSIPGRDNGQTCNGSGKVVGTEGGNGSKWWAKDRASLHRALDAVMDGTLGLLTCGWCGKQIRESLARPGKYTHLTEADATACAHPAMPK
jgi:hypothetical protein